MHNAPSVQNPVIEGSATIKTSDAVAEDRSGPVAICLPKTK